MNPRHGEEGGRIGAPARAAGASANEFSGRVPARIGTRAALRFLMEAGHTLASSLEYETTLQALANLAVPRVSCYCAVYIVDRGGGVRRMASARAAAKAVSDSDPAAASQRDLPNDWGLERLLVAEEPMLISRVEEDELRELVQHEEVAELMRRLTATSLMLVPLIARGSRLGLLVLASTRTDRRYYGPEDLDVARELGRIASLAIDNARMYRMAQEAIQARDQILRVVAHDLRNPLNAVILGTEFVMDELSRKEWVTEHRSLRTVSRAARRMDRLIQDLLDVARIEAGRLSVTLAPEPLAALLGEAVEMHSGPAAELGVELHYRESDDLPRVMADHARLLQVLGNLIGNAMKFSPAGGRVELGAEVDGEDVRCWVADNGPGIEQELLPHLFDPYWQAQESDRRGLGLGLAIVRGLIDAHGGRVWVDSSVGEGTRVSFTLPRAADPPSIASLAGLPGRPPLRTGSEPAAGMPWDGAHPNGRAGGARPTGALRDDRREMPRRRPPAASGA